MVLFYTENIENNIAYFEGDELKHILQSMRKKSGDSIDFVDGKGYFYKGRIDESDKRKLIVRITESRKDEQNDVGIHIAVSPTKNQDRIEWLVEKSIELGVSEISFIQCKHSERKNIKAARIKRIAIAAMKQSLKARIPTFYDLRPMEDWLKETHAEQSLIASLHDNTIPIVQAYDPARTVRICVGPEGGFRESEVEAAMALGFKPVSLGAQRLRTETAALYSISTMHVLKELQKL